MEQTEYKEAIFAEKEEIKGKLGKVYDSKKLAKAFLVVFSKIDFLTFCKMPANEQRELVEKVFGSPELAFGNIVRDEIATAYNLANKRKETKREEQENG